jgi:transposase-like protein
MPARHRLTKSRGKAKIKVKEKRQAVMSKILESYSEQQDTTIAVIQELIPLGLQAVGEELQREVQELAGKRYQRGGEISRWGSQPGSVYLRDQKLPIMVPRVRNTYTDQEVRLAGYEKLQQPFAGDRQTFLKLLNGISTHKYRQSAELVPEVFGISASNVSKRFRFQTARRLEQLQTRSLAEHDFVAIFVDGKRYAQDGLLIALGITIDGVKMILGIEQLHSENARAVEQFFQRLIDRGLAYDQGILFIIDGSKGLERAIEQRFGIHAFIQRCQWHKRENVIAYLGEAQQDLCRHRMQEAYTKTTYTEAKHELEKLDNELSKINPSAAASLREGMEETLTLHRLGLAPELGKSLNTTNCIESVMSQLGQYTDKVDRWHNGQQILRWTAAGLLEIEGRLNRIYGARYLKILRFKMQEIIRERQNLKNPITIKKSKVSQVVSVADR